MKGRGKRKRNSWVLEVIFLDKPFFNYAILELGPRVWGILNRIMTAPFCRMEGHLASYANE